ncbi:MAG: endonuclease V, partial [archaeon]
MKTKIDTFLVDGDGFAHPRRFGLACHIGLALCAPVIGVAKSLLVGTIKDSQILDGDEVIGVVLHSNSGKT